MIENLLTTIAKRFGDGLVEITAEGLQPTLQVHKDILRELCLLLRDDPAYYFDFLANISAVDYFPENKFAVVYNLTSIPYQKQITLKVVLDNTRELDQLPEIDSVSGIWRTADWHEREAYDLMGIFFVGHPDLRRILLPDDWAGYPLRKDYQEAESYRGIPINN